MTGRNRYELLRVLGGATDNVWLAADRLSGDKRVIKRLPLVSFQKECFILSSLPAGGFPNLTETFTDGASGFLVMDYQPGRSLEAYIREKGRPGNEEAWEIAQKTAELLIRLSKLNPPVVHRDLKPANIYITDQGEVTLLDFGSASRISAKSAEERLAPGTPGYAAPEQYKNRADVRTDIYGLGMTMKRMTRGYGKAAPRERGTSARRGTRGRRGPDAGFSRIARKASRRNPNQRYQSPEELRDALLRSRAGRRTIHGIRAALIGALSLALLMIVALRFGFSRKKNDKTIQDQAAAANALAEHLWDAAGLFTDNCFRLELSRAASDFEYPAENLDILIREEERALAERAARGEADLELVADYHSLTRLLALRASELGQGSLTRRIVLAADAARITRELYADTPENKWEILKREERYFLETLIVASEEEGSEETAEAFEYRKRLAELNVMGNQ